MTLLHATWTLAKKDLRVFVRDRTGMALGFGLPVILVLAFGFVYKIAFGGQGSMSKTTLWAIDLDQSDASKAFVAALAKSPTVTRRPRDGETPPDRDTLRKKVEDGEAHHALVIEAGFGATLAEGRFPRMTMFRDPDRGLESQLVSIALMQAFFSAGAEKLAPLLTTRALELSGLPEEWRDRILSLSTTFTKSVEALFVQAEGEGKLRDSNTEEGTDGSGSGINFTSVMSDMIPLERIDIKPPERPKQLSYMLAHNVSGISVMMLMFGLVACGTLLLQEREQGTLQRLMVLAMPRSSILWGKFLFTAIMGACQLVVMFGVGELAFKVSILRDLSTLIVLSLALLIAVTSFGVLIAALARTQKQAEGLSTIIILVMSAVGGAWFPIQMVDLPLAGEIAAKCTLTWWAMSSFQGMLWYGKSWTDPTMLRDVGVLLAFAIVASLTALLAFRRRFLRG
ncbi:MAG: ABC transporter permease [Planctomycetota bacterium]